VPIASVNQAKLIFVIDEAAISGTIHPMKRKEAAGMQVRSIY
jgi:hypothetical protein